MKNPIATVLPVHIMTIEFCQQHLNELKIGGTDVKCCHAIHTVAPRRLSSSDHHTSGPQKKVFLFNSKQNLSSLLTNLH